MEVATEFTENGRLQDLFFRLNQELTLLEDQDKYTNTKEVILPVVA
jgi:hypothetical protein